MRDPKRIDRMLKKLEELWKQNPDWRLGQLVFNSAAHAGWDNYDVFYCEDDQMERGLEQLKWNQSPPSS